MGLKCLYYCILVTAREEETLKKKLTKQGEISLLCFYIKANCTTDQIKAMFELLTGVHTNYDLQAFFNNNKDIKNNPQVFAQMT